MARYRLNTTKYVLKWPKKHQKVPKYNKKSRIRETLNLSTDADSSTDAIGGWTKNTPKPNFFWKTEKIIQNAKTQKRLELDGVAPD